VDTQDEPTSTTVVSSPRALDENGSEPDVDSDGDLR
jgi:hypothetical protein